MWIRVLAASILIVVSSRAGCRLSAGFCGLSTRFETLDERLLASNYTRVLRALRMPPVWRVPGKYQDRLTDLRVLSLGKGVPQTGHTLHSGKWPCTA
jgi:hypothetical protein